MLKIFDENIKNYLNVNNLKDEQHIIKYFLNIKGKCYRNVKNRVTLRINIDNQSYFIKKHLSTPIKEILKNILSLKWPFSGANNEYKAITKLKNIGINTLDVSAISSYGFSNNEGFIITNAIEPNIELDAYCKLNSEKEDYYKLKRFLIKFVADNTRKMHLGGMNHRDYYLCHYLFSLDNQKTQDCSIIGEQLINNIYLIDLHRMQMRDKVPKRYLIKDLSALLFSARDLELTKADKLRFVREYMKVNDSKKLKQILRQERQFWLSVFKKSQQYVEKG